MTTAMQYRWLSAWLVLALSACASGNKGADLDVIYSQTAQDDRPDRNPVIVIPGILGSRLKDTDTDTTVWGAFVGGAADPQNANGARLISLPIAEGQPLANLQDHVVPDGVMEAIKVEILGIPIELKAYAAIMSTLGAGGYRDQSLGIAGAIDYGTDHYTCFQYAFDWRRSNAENAAVLFQFIKDQHAKVQAEHEKRFGIKDANIKFDIVAHSMGGLVTRYMLRYGDQPLPDDGSLPELTWAGAKYVSRVVLVGTPNAGSADALIDLVEGRDIGMPFLPFYQPALMGTFPAVYELLPRARHGHIIFDADKNRPIEDLYDPEIWVRMGWGLADPKEDKVLKDLLPNIVTAQERRRIALDLQARILRNTRAFAAALDRPAYLPPGMEMILVAGDATPTKKIISVNSQTGELTVLEQGIGDGTVLRTSVLLDEREGSKWHAKVQSPIDFTSAMFLPEDHLGLTSSNTFRDNVLYWLLEAPNPHDPLPGE